ncbi:MAG: HEAT repeat domain-containing protein, partial [Candidatus Poribacteria bacterium]|nr:HEAT repeat domain-containing protein [Candidatus Poribacteria bacterium]
MEAQRLSRFIRILKSPTTPTQQRVAALERLKDSKQPEVLAAIATSCQAAPSAILEKSREIISNLSYEDFSMLVHFLLSDASGGHMGRVVFEVLYELKSRDVLRYIIEFASNTSETDARRKTMTKWMKDLNITEDCLQIMLNLPSWKDSTPSVLALALGKALRRMDDSVIASTVKLIRKANSDVSLKGLGILEEIAKGRDISQLLMGILRETDDERVKSKVTKTIVKLSGNLRMVREALKDSDSRVRANALEFLWGIKEHKQQRVAKLLAEPHLSDFDNRTRANAGRVFYALGDPRGLETLLEMLDSPDELMRASAVWMLGEVREASLMGKLQELAQTDASQIVAENAKKALEKMGVWKLTVTDLLASLRDFTLRDPKTGLPQDKNYLTMLESFQARPSQELSDMMQVIQTTSPDLYMRMLAQVENSANEEAALAMLLAAAYCKDSRVRSHATLLIGQICGDEAVFRHFLADTDVRVKANAIEALEQHSAPFVTPMLVDSLRSANNRVLANAAKALCKRADLRGWRTLLINLRHSEPAFRASCVWALGEVGKPNITERLEFLKHDADENVRKHVRIALDKITARARKTPDAIRAKIRYVHVNRYPRVTCYVYVHSQEYPLTGLYAENFKIKENDISLPFKLSTQENSTQGLSIVILMDYSLSMSEGNLE